MKKYEQLSLLRASVERFGIKNKLLRAKALCALRAPSLQVTAFPLFPSFQILSLTQEKRKGVSRVSICGHKCAQQNMVVMSALVWSQSPPTTAICVQVVAEWGTLLPFKLD